MNAVRHLHPHFFPSPIFSSCGRWDENMRTRYMGLGAMVSARQTCEFPEMTQKKFKKHFSGPFRVAAETGCRGGDGQGLLNPSVRLSRPQSLNGHWWWCWWKSWSGQAAPDNPPRDREVKPGLFLFYLLFCSGAIPGRALGTKCGARDWTGIVCMQGYAF